jgi:hypothetical protein
MSSAHETLALLSAQIIQIGADVAAAVAAAQSDFATMTRERDVAIADAATLRDTLTRVIAERDLALAHATDLQQQLDAERAERTRVERDLVSALAHIEELKTEVLSVRAEYGAHMAAEHGQSLDLFTVAPTSVLAGAPVVVNWATSRASEVRLNGELVDQSGSREVVLQQSTTITLAVRGYAPEITQSIAVEVTQPEPEPQPTPVMFTGAPQPHPEFYGDIWRPYDGPSGMTWSAYNRGATLAWRTPGGDFDPTPAATVAAKPVVGTPMAWDVTAIVGAEGLMVRGAQAVKFSSREGATSPELVIERVDGTSETLTPIADTTLSPSSTSALGKSSVLTLGAGNQIALFFTRQSGPVVRATLRLMPTATYSYSGTPTWTVHAMSIPRQDVAEPVQFGLAAQYPRDQGITAHPSVLKAGSFRDGDYMFDAGNPDRQVVVGDGANTPRDDGYAPLVPGDRAAEVYMSPTTVSAKYPYGYAAFRDHGELPELYARFYLRLGRNFRDSQDGGKLPGIDATYYRPDTNYDRPVCGNGGASCGAANIFGDPSLAGKLGWSTRGGFSMIDDRGNPVYPRVQTHWYVYAAEQVDLYGFYVPWGVAGLLELERDYCIEQYVRVNTPGVRDGVVRVWVDGRLSMERADLMLRGAPPYHEYVTGEQLIRRWWATAFYGGKYPPSNPAGHTLWMRNFVVAREYIGPMVA